MAELNTAARLMLREAGVSEEAWARHNRYSDGDWYGDACGCPDDRCIGYHHFENEPCGCLPVLLADLIGKEEESADDRP
jgi:hypothetical protein